MLDNSDPHFLNLRYKEIFHAKLNGFSRSEICCKKRQNPVLWLKFLDVPPLFKEMAWNLNPTLLLGHP